VLILFTDGISEAMNKQDEEFSDKILEELALSIANENSNEILNKIKNEVQKFTTGTLQSDDMTMVVVKVK
jgi:sigma-B regulation protein RsbU (phosphoserine phosphatase)